MKITILFAMLTILAYMCLIKFTDLKNRSMRTKITLGIIMLLVVIVRVYRFWSTMGLDVDEAMGGYNAWSISKYGVDMTLKHMPVYFYAWGSGMNALYLYITVPFIKMFGLSVFSYRLPMVVISILAAFYFLFALLKVKWQDKNIILAMIVIFLSPATITTSRWSVESNIYPSLMVVFVATFLLFLESKGWKKTTLFVIYNALLAISAYAYSNNWLFLACSTILVYSWLLYTKKISIKQLLLGISTIVLIIWPLFLFIWVNYVSHKELEILGLTITKLAVTRGGSQFAFANGDIIPSIVKNIIASTTMLVTGNDGMTRIELPIFGPFYPFYLVFAFIGILKKCSSKFTKFDFYILLLLMASIPTFVLIVPNFVHFNAMLIPILYFEYIGLSETLTNKFMQNSFIIITLLLLFLFANSYLTTNAQELQEGGIEVSSDFGNAINATHKLKGNEVYIISRYEKILYPAVLFYEKINPQKFYKTKEKLPPADHMYYGRFDKYRIYGNTNGIKPKNNNMYVVQNNYGADLSIFSDYKSINYGTYTVYYK